MEVGCESPTHFGKFTNSVNIIECFFRSAMGWMTWQVMTDVCTIDSPEALCLKGVSDHAAVSVRLRLRGAHPQQERPIPKHTVTSKLFQQRLHEDAC
eukprot:5635637-Pyramimonas_sp.AAC.1